jgi:hypothetical protein
LAVGSTATFQICEPSGKSDDELVGERAHRRAVGLHVLLQRHGEEAGVAGLGPVARVAGLRVAHRLAVDREDAARRLAHAAGRRAVRIGDERRTDGVEVVVPVDAALDVTTLPTPSNVFRPRRHRVIERDDVGEAAEGVAVGDAEQAIRGVARRQLKRLRGDAGRRREGRPC